MSISKKPYSRNFFFLNLALVSAIVGSAIAYAGFFLRPVWARAWLSTTVLRAESPANSPPSDVEAAIAKAEAVQKAFDYVAETVQPSVVEINVVMTKSDRSTPQEQSPWPFFGPPDRGQNNQPPRQERGLGSGIIVRHDGKTVYVLTNDHVVGSATEIKVLLDDKREFKARLVGKDDRKDLALVKFETDSRSIAVATLGDSSTLKVGDWAIAIGNPFGFVSSVTTGTVSALGRSGGPSGNISDFIQTDASINSGNSGGALVDIRGEVVGINTWIASPSGGSIGLGFAIPINNAKSAIDEFIAKGKLSYGWLGVSLANMDEASAAELGVDPRKGALVSEVFKGSPAGKGGFFPGDVVLNANGADVAGVDQLVRIVGDLPAGKAAGFTLFRDGKSLKLSVGIVARPDNLDKIDSAMFPGVDVVSLQDQDLDASKLPKGVRGVFVADVIPKSPAAAMGLAAGDIVTAVNDQELATVRDFYRLINDPAVRKIAFAVNRDGQAVTTLAYVKETE